jgi:hypothetical protein
MPHTTPAPSHLLRLTAVAAGLGLLTNAACAQLLAYDGFGNGPLATLGGSTGGSGWSGPWVDAGTDPTIVAGAGLDYAGLAATPGAAVTPNAVGTWPSSILQRAWPAPAAGSAIYVSFLLRDDAGQGIWGGLSFGQYPYKMTVGSPLGYYTYGLMTSQGVGSLASKPLVQGETTLVVVKIASNPAPATGTTYRLYLDPAIGSAEPSFPAASFGLSMVSALPTYLSLDNGTGFTTDEIRVGTTWAAVLPAQPSVWTDIGFAKPGVTGAPHLAGAGPLTANSSNSILLSNANPNAAALQVIGFVAVNTPFMGGILVPEPVILIPLTTTATGAASWQVTLPAGVPAGLPVRLQHWIQDPAASFGWSASNGLLGICQ